MSTAQAIGPPGSLSTAQGTRQSGRLVTDQVGSKPRRLVTDQAPVPVKLDDVGWNIVAFCEIPRSMAEIMGELGLTHRTFFRRNHLEPLLAGGVLRMTHPDQPNHPHQAYVLTETGVALMVRRAKEACRDRQWRADKWHVASRMTGSADYFTDIPNEPGRVVREVPRRGTGSSARTSRSSVWA